MMEVKGRTRHVEHPGQYLRPYIKDIPQQLMAWLQHDLEQAKAA